jgi:hypothetical protein
MPTTPQGLAAQAQSHMPSLVGRPHRISDSGVVGHNQAARTPLMRERSEILKSKSEVLHSLGGSVGSRLPGDRLGRAVSVEAAAAAAAGGVTPTAAVLSGHTPSEGLGSSPSQLDFLPFFVGFVNLPCLSFLCPVMLLPVYTVRS